DGAVRGAEGAETLAVIRKETARMGKIISQLLMLTRGYEGRCHIEKEDLDLREEVDSVMDELAETAAASRIRLTDLTPAGCLVYADQSLLTQLLINLIGNSIKYGVPGGRVVVQADAGARGCTFSVSDDGIASGPKSCPTSLSAFTGRTRPGTAPARAWGCPSSSGLSSCTAEACPSAASTAP